MNELFEHIGEGQQPSASEYNRLVDAVTALLNSTFTQYFSDSRGFYARRMPTETVGDTLTLFRIIDTNVVVDGMYECYEQQLSNPITSANPFSDLNTTTVYVYNIAERDLTDQALSIDDLLLAYKMTDEDAETQWIGFSPEHSWWHV